MMAELSVKTSAGDCHAGVFYYQLSTTYALRTNHQSTSVFDAVLVLRWLRKSYIIELAPLQQEGYHAHRLLGR